MTTSTTPEPPISSASRDRLKRFAIIVVVAIVAFALTAGAALLILRSVGGFRREAVPAASGVTVKTFATLPADNAYPVGIARDGSGTIFVSAFGSDVIYRLTADGALQPWLDTRAAITAPAAIASARDGALYVIDFNSSNPGTAVGTLKRITADGRVSMLPGTENNAGLSFLSHLAFSPDGDLFVSYTAESEIWRFPASGSGERWLALPATGADGKTAAQPTGLAFDSANDALVVADAAGGAIYRVKRRNDGSADTPVVLYRRDGMAVAALAFDGAGRLLFAHWSRDNGELERLESSGAATLLAQGFRAPSALLVLNNDIYVVNSDLPGLIPTVGAKPPFTIDEVSTP